MLELNCRTREGGSPERIQKVYFTCHRDDFSDSVGKISKAILKAHNCAVYHTNNMDDEYGDDARKTLKKMNLFVFPVTRKLLQESSRAIDVDLKFAYDNKIPILPIIMEEGEDVEKLYTSVDKLANRQYLVWRSDTDSDPGLFEEKMRKHLDFILSEVDLFNMVNRHFSSRIFLSYRKKDVSYANSLLDTVHSYEKFRDVAIWYDEFLRVGEDFNENIREIMRSSDVFMLLVTKNLLEKGNYVMEQEYPYAKEIGMKILPVVMDDTDYGELKRFFKDEDMPPFVRLTDSDFASVLEGLLTDRKEPDKLQRESKDYLLGLAYLYGIDVEVNRELGLEFITGHAEHNYTSMLELYAIYKYGNGTDPDDERADYWLNRYEEVVYEEFTGKAHYRIMMNLLAMKLIGVEEYERALSMALKSAAQPIADEEDRRALAISYELIATCYLHLADADKLIDAIGKAYSVMLGARTVGQKYLSVFYYLTELLINLYEPTQQDREIYEKAYTVSTLMDEALNDKRSPLEYINELFGQDESLREAMESYDKIVDRADRASDMFTPYIHLLGKLSNTLDPDKDADKIQRISYAIMRITTDKLSEHQLERKQRCDLGIRDALVEKMIWEQEEVGPLSVSDKEKLLDVLEELCEMRRGLPDTERDRLIDNLGTLTILYKGARNFKSAVRCQEERYALQSEAQEGETVDSMLSLGLLVTVLLEWRTQLLSHSDKKGAKRLEDKVRVLKDKFVSCCKDSPELLKSENISMFYRALKDDTVFRIRF